MRTLQHWPHQCGAQGNGPTQSRNDPTLARTHWRSQKPKVLGQEHRNYRSLAYQRQSPLFPPLREWDTPYETCWTNWATGGRGSTGCRHRRRGNALGPWAHRRIRGEVPPGHSFAKSPRYFQAPKLNHVTPPGPRLGSATLNPATRSGFSPAPFSSLPQSRAAPNMTSLYWL